MDDGTVTGNHLEAALGFLFALGFVGKGWTTSSKRGRRFWLLSAAFTAFGMSDLIEATTGVWWRPSWLFVLKQDCVAALVYGIWTLR